MNVSTVINSTRFRLRGVGIVVIGISLGLAGCDRGGTSDRRPSSDSGLTASLDAVATNWPRPPEKEPSVRIRVRSLPVAQTRGVLGTDQQTLLLLDGAKRRPYVLDAPVSIEAAESRWTIRDSGGQSIELDELVPLSLRTLKGAPGTIQWDEEELPGSLELVPRPSVDPETVDLVARIKIEEYIPGVLDGELYGSWAPSCFEAQAVAARSYAVSEAAFWGPRRHYDMVAGPASQAWSGLGNSERALQAAESTRGVVLLFEDRVVPAFYSACCGGRSASAYEAISDRPSHRINPLVARADDERSCCEAAAVREWTLQFDLVDLAPRLRAWGKAREDQALASLGLLQSCTLLESNSAGRPLAFELVDTRGKHAQIDAQSLRNVLGGVPRLPDRRTGRLRSSAINPVVRDGRLEVRGWGYGHGVGLCQYGAQGMADSGAGWEDILERYYPGADPVRVWSGPR